MFNTAIVLLRYGSKGIPQKNLRLLNGKPLFFWTINAIIESASFSEILISTESHEIASAVTNIFGTKVRIHLRPGTLAQDSSSTEDVLLDETLHLKSDWLGLFQVTSPLITKEQIQKAAEYFTSMKYDSLLSVCEFKRFLWTQEGHPINYNPQKRPRRQEFVGCLIENGAFYFMKSEGLKKNKCRLFGNIGTYLLPEEMLHEVDSPQDLVVVESLLKAQNQSQGEISNCPE